MIGLVNCRGPDGAGCLDHGPPSRVYPGLFCGICRRELDKRALAERPKNVTSGNDSPAPPEELDEADRQKTKRNTKGKK